MYIFSKYTFFPKNNIFQDLPQTFCEEVKRVLCNHLERGQFQTAWHSDDPVSDV